MDRDPRLRRRQITCQRLSAGKRPIDNANLGGSGIAEGHHDSSSRPTRAEYHHRSRRRIPLRRKLAQILAKAEGVGVGAFQARVRRYDDLVYTPYSTSQRIDPIDYGKSRLLVRDGQIAASKAENR